MTRFKHPPIDSNVPLRKDGTKVRFGFGGEDDDDDAFTKTSILSLNIFVASRNDVGGVEDDTRVLFDSGDDDDDDEFTKPSILSSVSRNDFGGVLFEDDMNLIVDMCLR